MKKLIMLLVLLATTSCMSFSDKPLRSVRDSITAQVPGIRLDKEFAVSIGSGLLNLIDVVTLNVADVSKMDHVQVAVYKISGRRRNMDFDNMDLEETMLAKDSKLHWETIVRVREDGEQVWVLAGMNLAKNTLEAVTVFVLEDDELVLINVDGDLEHLIEFALSPAEDRRTSVRTG